MKLNCTTWLSVIILIIALCSCKDRQLLLEPHFRIKKVTKQGDQQFSTDTYTYDSQGRLDNIYKAYTDRRKTSNRDYYYTTVFQYNAQGKLSAILYQPDDKALGTVGPSRYDYTYDVDGNVTTIKNTYGPSGSANSRTFNLVYNGNKFPVKITDKEDAFEDIATTEYIYDKENAVRIKTYTVNGIGTITSSYTRDYQFDTKPNPFYNSYIGAPDPDIVNDYAFKLNTFYQSNTFNKNNAVYDGLTYEYDTNGNLVKITGIITTTLEYEVY